MLLLISDTLNLLGYLNFRGSLHHYGLLHFIDSLWIIGLLEPSDALYFFGMLYYNDTLNFLGLLSCYDTFYIIGLLNQFWYTLLQCTSMFTMVHFAFLVFYIQMMHYTYYGLLIYCGLLGNNCSSLILHLSLLVFYTFLMHYTIFGLLIYFGSLTCTGFLAHIDTFLSIGFLI